jgi:hypothetical protein
VPRVVLGPDLATAMAIGEAPRAGSGAAAGPLP